MLKNAPAFLASGAKVAKCLLLAIPLQAQAPDWTREDTAWEVACLSVIVADWAQTRYISRHPAREVTENVWVKNPDGSPMGYVPVTRSEGFKEMNPILGPRPSTRKVDAYFLASAVGHVALARWLSPPHRRTFQALSLGWELAFVGGNVRAGVKMRW